MNSDEIFIKLMFFGIVAGIAVASLGAIVIVRRVRMSSATTLVRHACRSNRYTVR